MTVLFYIAMAAASAVVFARFLRGRFEPDCVLLAGIVIGLTCLIVPVQLDAALQIAGIAHRIAIPALLLAQALILTAAVACALSRRTLSRRAPVPTPPTPRPNRPTPAYLIASVVIVALTYAAFVARMFFAFPDGFDAIAYHYPVALRWLQDGSLAVDASTAWLFSLPGNLEILAMLTLAGGHDRLLPWVCWPALAALILSCRILVNRVFQTPAALLPILLIVLTIPMICYQTFSGYVDLFGASMLFAALALFVAASHDGFHSAYPLLIVGLACGIATGTKPTFWPLTLLLCLGFVWTVGRRASWRSGKLPIHSAILLAGIAIPSVFWFGRAYFATGNPVYPMQVRLLGHVLAGFSPSAITPPDYDLDFVRTRAEWILFPWTEWKRQTGYLLQSYSEVTGLGGMFATFSVPGVAYAAWLCFRRRPTSRALLPGVVAVFVLLVMWWFVYSRNLRFLLPLPILATLLSGPLLEALDRISKRVYRALFLCALSATCAILVFEPLHAIASTLRTRDWSRAAFFNYPTVFDRLPPGSTVLNLAEDSYDFPLAGAQLTVRVISRRETPPVLTPEWLKSHNVAWIAQRPAVIGFAAAEPVPPCSGLALVYKKTTKYDNGSYDQWLIWQVSK